MQLNLTGFNQARLLVVGDLMLDRYWHGPTQRISPEAPVPVVKVERIEDRPGGAANVALNLASLGAQACLLGLTGQDEAAQTLEQSLQASGVRCQFQRSERHPTITKLRVLSRHQQLLRLDFEQSFADADHQAFKLLVEQALSVHMPQAVIFSDYAKGALAQVQDLIHVARLSGVPVLVDPKGTDFARYRGATLLTPNLSEFEAVVGACANEQQLVERGLKLIQQYDWQALLVTRGEQGMSLLRPGKAPLHLPAQAREVFDVTGAGDTVIASLGLALACGLDLPQAVSLANVAAGIVVGKLGTSTLTVSELSQALVPHGPTEGVVTEAQLLASMALARQRGERVVMTNGCFDILHAGHVSYLQQAKALGDRLIVAVNSDESVSGLKGPSRPVNPLAQRMKVLAALGAVDWVVPFVEDTPARLIGQVLPDVLVKGGDYRPEQIAGAHEVWANGGEVKILGFEPGCSTSSIIERIKEEAK